MIETKDFINLQKEPEHFRQSIGPQVDITKIPKRIITEYKIGNPTKDIRKTETLRDTEKSDMPG